MAIKNNKQQSSWSGMNDVQTTRQYFDVVGDYVCELLQLSHDTSPKGEEFVGGDFKVIESDNDEITPGQTRSTYIGKKKLDYYFKRDVKELLLALAPNTEDVEALIVDAVGEDQPLKGTKIVIRVFPDPKGNVNEKTGKPYLRQRFMSLAAAGINAADLPSAA